MAYARRKIPTLREVYPTSRQGLIPHETDPPPSMTTLNFGSVAHAGIDKKVPRKQRIKERDEQLSAFLASCKKPAIPNHSAVVITNAKPKGIIAG